MAQQQGGYAGVLGGIQRTLGQGGTGWGVAGPAAQAISDTQAQQQAAIRQQLGNSGLSNSTVLGQMERGPAYDAQKAYAGLGAQLAQTYAGYQANEGNAGLQSAAALGGAQLGQMGNIYGQNLNAGLGYSGLANQAGINAANLAYQAQYNPLNPANFGIQQQLAGLRGGSGSVIPGTLGSGGGSGGGGRQPSSPPLPPDYFGPTTGQDLTRRGGPGTPIGIPGAGYPGGLYGGLGAGGISGGIGDPGLSGGGGAYGAGDFGGGYNPQYDPYFSGVTGGGSDASGFVASDFGGGF